MQPCKERGGIRTFPLDPPRAKVRRKPSASGLSATPSVHSLPNSPTPEFSALTGGRRGRHTRAQPQGRGAAGQSLLLQARPGRARPPSDMGRGTAGPPDARPVVPPGKRRPTCRPASVPPLAAQEPQSASRLRALRALLPASAGTPFTWERPTRRPSPRPRAPPHLRGCAGLKCAEDDVHHPLRGQHVAPHHRSARRGVQEGALGDDDPDWGQAALQAGRGGEARPSLQWGADPTQHRPKTCQPARQPGSRTVRCAGSRLQGGSSGSRTAASPPSLPKRRVSPSSWASAANCSRTLFGVQLLHPQAGRKPCAPMPDPPPAPGQWPGCAQLLTWFSGMSCPTMLRRQ